jgi:predicted TIM-barrel enzyme
MLDAADGAIVGSFFKKNGQLANPVDADRVRQIVEIARKVR